MNEVTDKVRRLFKYNTLRVLYLVILYIYVSDFWNLRFAPHLSGNIYLIALIFYLAVGVFLWHRKIFNKLKGKYYPLILIVIGVAISMISAYLFSSQSISQSILTYKNQYVWIFIPVLFYTAPSKKELERSFKWYTVLYTVIYALRYAAPSLFALSDEGGLYRGAVLVPGFSFVIFSYVFYLQRLRNKYSNLTLLKVVVILLLMLSIRNRSIMIPCVLFFLYTIYKVRSKNKFLIYSLVSIILIIVTIQLSDIWMPLIEQTTAELTSDDYNRNIALDYFLFEASPNVFCYIFGNGFLSSNTSSLVQDLMEEGIYNSDMGFIGTWNQFGILVIIGVVWICIMSIFSKSSPFYLNLASWKILLCAYTTSYFGSVETILIFCIVYYLFYYNKLLYGFQSLNQPNTISKHKTHAIKPRLMVSSGLR